MNNGLTKRLASSILFIFLATSGVAANAGLIFSFQDVGNNLVMTSSGTIDTRKLIANFGQSNWTNDGFGTFGNYSFIGDGSTHGVFDRFYSFSPRTDFSQWHASNNIFTSLQFDPDFNTGTQSFSTIHFPQPYTPGFNAVSTDIVDYIWTPNATWTFIDASIESYGLTKGTYTVTDARSGEFIRYQVGPVDVPEPSSLLLFLAAIGFMYRRFLRLITEQNV